MVEFSIEVEADRAVEEVEADTAVEEVEAEGGDGKTHRSKEEVVV